MTTGEATRAEDLLLLLERSGYAEECYFSFSYSPIRDETGGVGGVFTPVKETTDKIIGERRLRTLRDLAAHTREAREVEAACERAIEVLAANSFDLPFALLYRIAAHDQMAHLSALVGIERGTRASPSEIDLNVAGNVGSWPLKSAFQSGKAQLVSDLNQHFGELPCGPWRVPPVSAIVLPVVPSAQDRPAALLICAISPHKALDGNYRGFLGLAADQIGAAIAGALAYEEERKRAEALAEIDRAKTAFFSNVSHEFRTPLTLMLGPLEEVLAVPREGLPQRREDLALVHRSALRLLRLVNTLLDFSRIEAGRVEASYEPTDLSAHTLELASVFRSAI